jgi:hypothetical protein
MPINTKQHKASSLFEHSYSQPAFLITFAKPKVSLMHNYAYFAPTFIRKYTYFLPSSASHKHKATFISNHTDLMPTFIS